MARFRPPGSEQTEGNFDGDNDRNGLAAGSNSGLETPLLYRFNGLFFQTEPRTLHYLNFDGTTVRGYNGLEDNRTLVLRLASFFRIFWIRAVST